WRHSLYIFIFNDTATTEIYTLSLHDALPIFFQTPLTSFTEQRARQGFEPGTSRTQSENHTPRPTSLAGTLFNAFLQHDFKVLHCQCTRNSDLDNHLQR